MKIFYFLKATDEKFNHMANVYVYNFMKKTIVIIEGIGNTNLLAHKPLLKQWLYHLQSFILHSSPVIILDMSNIYGLTDFLRVMDKNLMLQRETEIENDPDVLEALTRYGASNIQKFQKLKKSL